ncbi:glycoside hydrolase family 127 protein, partial [Candidatus Bathyarchaeota archaeon]|nr:glycoside hydrolase family 127 protein [Candidatus Bathyarchaeota archaeon]
PNGRWENVRDRHELYCAGHLMEAAVAHYRATGKKHFLDSLCKFADHIDSRFGRDEGKVRGYPGHEEIELALVKLYHATGNGRYRDLASFFIRERGEVPYFFQEEARGRGEANGDFFGTIERMKHWQAHAPIIDQQEAVGHAVRAGYFYAGAVDIAREQGDIVLLDACKRLWTNIATSKLYITGGTGARYEGEAFGDTYELPSESAYAETCAAIAFILFSHRLLQVDLDAKYADEMERALYNGMISGVSLDGRNFFYVNPLSYTTVPGEKKRHQRNTNRRQEWFGCACCPNNLSRLIASIGSFAYSIDDAQDTIAVHLFIESKVNLELGATGTEVIITQETAYPWNGDVAITMSVEKNARFSMLLRIPGWCNHHEININDEKVDAAIVNGYARLERAWRDGDLISFHMDMPVARIHANPRVAELHGRVAITRGPIVYCIEGADNGKDLQQLLLPASSALQVDTEPSRLGGMPCITARGYRSRIKPSAINALYTDIEGELVPEIIRFIPYHAWGNRKPGDMLVWIRECMVCFPP